MEEISLKEIIIVLLKGKYLILASTAAALLLGVAAYALLPDQYRTTVSILANPILDAGGLKDEATGQFALPNMDISSYRQQFLNNYTLRKTIEELGIKDKQDAYISNGELAGAVTVANPDKTNILDVSVTGGDAQRVTEIANSLGRHFIDYITDVYQSSAGASAKALSEQLVGEEEKLNASSIRYRDYLIASDNNIDTMNAEISGLITQITEFKMLLNSVDLAIASNDKNVAQLNERLRGSEPAAETDAETDMYADVGDYQLRITGDDLAQSLYTIKTVEAETRLIENQNDKAALEGNIAAMGDRLSGLQAQLAEEKHKHDAIRRDFNLAVSSYDAYTEMYRQALILEAANLGAVNIKIISEAIAPTAAYNKSIVLFGGVSGVLGVFLGMFIALFKNYWGTTAA